MIKQMVIGFLLEFDATLNAECGFLEHLHSLREVKFKVSGIVPRLWRPVHDSPSYCKLNMV